MVTMVRAPIASRAQNTRRHMFLAPGQRARIVDVVHRTVSNPIHQPPAHTLGDVLDRIDGLGRASETATAGVTVGALMGVIGRRGYGPLLLIVGLISISPLTLAPGTTWFVAAIAFLLSLQMAAGALHPWLPTPTLRLVVPFHLLGNVSARLRPWAARLDSVLAPRLTFLADPPLINFGAAVCVVAALLTFPLALIPIAPLAPGVAITLFGLGVTVRDGLLLGLSGVSVAAAGWLAYAAFMHIHF
jgi:hypothetical protein